MFQCSNVTAVFGTDTSSISRSKQSTFEKRLIGRGGPVVFYYLIMRPTNVRHAATQKYLLLEVGAPGLAPRLLLVDVVLHSARVGAAGV